jgi:hypothetical protein
MNKNWFSSVGFGVVGGFFSAIAFVVFYFIKKDPTSLGTIFGYAILPFILFFGLRYYKKYIHSNSLSFAEGMSIGFVIYTVLASISGFLIYVFLMVHSPAFQEIKSSKISHLIQNKQTIVEQINVESYDKTYDSIVKMTESDLALNDFIWKIIPGLFFTIIISIILRENKT